MSPQACQLEGCDGYCPYKESPSRALASLILELPGKDAPEIAMLIKSVADQMRRLENGIVPLCANAETLRAEINRTNAMLNQLRARHHL